MRRDPRWTVARETWATNMRGPRPTFVRAFGPRRATAAHQCARAVHRTLRTRARPALHPALQAGDTSSSACPWAWMGRGLQANPAGQDAGEACAAGLPPERQEPRTGSRISGPGRSCSENKPRHRGYGTAFGIPDRRTIDAIRRTVSASPRTESAHPPCASRSRDLAFGRSAAAPLPQRDS